MLSPNNLELIRYRLLLWAQSLKERTAKAKLRTIKGSSSIYRANLDGSSISRVVKGFTDWYYFVLDRQHGRIYWEYTDCNGLYVFDILEGQKPLIVPAFSRDFLARKILLYVSGEIFIWSDPSEVILIDATKEVGNLSLLYQRGDDENYLEFLPKEVASSEEIRKLNPCLRKNCSHVCTLSGPEGASCLCGRNEDLSLDQVTCTERFLLVSAGDGAYQLGLNAQSAIDSWDLLNISAAELVAHDSVNGELYWVEQDVGKGAAQIYRREDASGKISLVSEVKFNLSRSGRQEIRAFGVDWITRNIYFAIQPERRIRSCNHNFSLCTEILGNSIRANICSMELLPQIRKLFWVDVYADENSGGKVYLKAAGMDGKGAKNIMRYNDSRVTHCPCMAIDRPNLSIYITLPEPSGVYRVDTFDLKGNKYRSAYLESRKYIPSHIYVSEGDLIWVGRPFQSTGASTNETDVIFKSRLEHNGRAFVYEEYDSWNLPRVKDLTFYGFSPNLMNSSIMERTSKSHQLCRGVRLLSENGSFRCACPATLRLTVDGLSCKRPEHVIVYATERGQVFLKNDSGVYPTSFTSSVSTFAHATRKNQLLWANSSGNFYGGIFSVADFTRFLRVEEVAHQNQSFVPKQIGYDWVGDNVFALEEGKGNIWVCGRTSGACAVIATQQEPLQGEMHFALDPNGGYLYWIVEGGKVIFRTQMDGTGKIASREFSFGVYTMTVDQNDGVLFFAYKWHSYGFGQPHRIDHKRISYVPFKADKHSVLIRLSDMPKELKVAAGYVFWSSWSTVDNTWSIFSCDKSSGNGLELHVSKGIPSFGRVVNLDVIVPNPQDSNICGGGLCSHICIPTTAGYMRCACPMGFRLGSDGWTCVPQCVNPDDCDAANDRQPEIKKPLFSPELVTSLNGNCEEGHFQCLSSEECLKINQACDGHADCKDLSDEDPRCNDICGTHPCSGNCTKSPVGPICTGQIDQKLADDLENGTSKMETPKPGTATPVSVFALVFGTLAAVLAVICLVLAWKYIQAQRKLRDMTEEEIREFMDGDSSAASLAPNGMDRAMMLPYKAILPPDSIVVDERVLGSGEYGVVHSGIFNGEVVAVKKLKRRVDVEEFKAVLAEMKIMSYLGDNENIVKFFGSDVSQIASCQITIVTELSPHGDLLHYLWKVGSGGLKIPQNSFLQQPPEPSVVSVRTLNQWCEQIASGMEYLVTKQVIHGDLAARNVLVFNSNVVKIADFGMSKQLYGAGRYTMKKQKKLPWKWGSIELLTFGEFSESSDVWAFGVTAWEIFSLGETPYAKIMRFDKQFIDYLREGNRLPQPTHAPRATFAFLLECWNADATSRPNFALLREFFHEQVQNTIQTEETGIASVEDSSYTLAL